MLRTLHRGVLPADVDSIRQIHPARGRDVFKVVFFLHRRPDLSVEAFAAYSKATHVPLVSQVPGLIRYVVNYAVANPMGAEAACDAVAELWFESMEGFQAALTTEKGKVALADQPNYLDMGRTHFLIVDEQVVRE